MRDQPREWWFEPDWAPSRSGQSTRICGKSARETSPISSWRRARCRRADRIPDASALSVIATASVGYQGQALKAVA